MHDSSLPDGSVFVESTPEDSLEVSRKPFELAPNQVLVSLPYALMQQLKYLARQEGIELADVMVDMAMDGIRRKQYEGSSRNGPSHLQTHTGYVMPDAHGYVPPTMSHHQQGQQQRSRPGQNFQNRNHNGGQGGKYQRPQYKKQQSPQGQKNAYPQRGYQQQGYQNQQPQAAASTPRNLEDNKE